MKLELKATRMEHVSEVAKKNEAQKAELLAKKQKEEAEIKKMQEKQKQQEQQKASSAENGQEVSASPTSNEKKVLTKTEVANQHLELKLSKTSRK